MYCRLDLPLKRFKPETLKVKKPTGYEGFAHPLNQTAAASVPDNNVSATPAAVYGRSNSTAAHKTEPTSTNPQVKPVIKSEMSEPVPSVEPGMFLVAVFLGFFFR